MEVADIFSRFMDMARDDPRIGPSHISVFMAILYFYRQQQANPLHVTRREIMNQAKISSLVTYSKCIRQLSDGRYIKYQVSFVNLRGCLISLFG